MCLRSLVSRGYVALYRGTAFHGEQTAVAAAEIDAALTDEEWEPSETDRQHTRFGATETGVRYYQGLGSEPGRRVATRIR